MSATTSIRSFARRLFGIPNAHTYIRALIEHGGCARALDIGCGPASVLAEFRPRLHTVGLDAFPEAIERAKVARQHDTYILADVTKVAPEEILAQSGGQRFDLVTLFDVLEHLPKRQGYDILEVCEKLTSKYVFLLTPNGFVEQGAEFGNVYQRHLSGWFTHELQGLGYEVHGACGAKFFHGYAGQMRFGFPGEVLADAVLSKLLRIKQNARFAFSLAAYKDVRGVPPRLGCAPAGRVSW